MSTTPSRRLSPMPVRIVKREDPNTNMIRSRYYQKLGVFAPPSLPLHRRRPEQQQEAHQPQSDDLSITSSSSSVSVSSSTSRPSLVESSSCSSFSSSSSTRSIPSPSCLRHKRSVLHTTPAKHGSVAFHPEVKLYRIKSHQDYSDQEWNNMWMDAAALDYAKDRNAFEFRADGAIWQHATEEGDFLEGPVAGELVHPATWFAYRHQWEQEGAYQEKLNFAALVAQQQQERPSRRRHQRRSSWSPRPTTHKKSFWLLDLAIQSVQKGKNQAAKSRHHQRQHNSITNSTITAKPPRHSDQGWP